jgi:hypothetical protein
MHGVPPDLDLSPLIGHWVSQICLDHNQIQLSFYPPADEEGLFKGPSGHLGIEGGWELVGPHGELVDRRQRPEADRDVYRIHQLLQRPVTGWAPNPPSAFQVSFDGGYVLRIIDDDPRYEYVSIRLPGSEGGGRFL